MAEENDIVLIYFENQPLSFARIEEIQPDNKPDWYHVTLLMLQVPLQVVTWILRDRYIMGDEFTMNGKLMRLEKVICPESPAKEDTSGQETPEKRPVQEDGRATVISLTDKRKK
jgi:hypothetical protein